MNSLEELFTYYGTDKGIWGYTPAYEKHLLGRRDGPQAIKNVLEIGICGFRDIPNNVVGASLFAWREYFPQAQIYGIDNDARFVFNDQWRIATALADAYNEHSLRNALMLFGAPQFDFICDDAVHDPAEQSFLVRRLWPYLAPGGVYAVEELCPYKLRDYDVWEEFVKPLMIEFETIKDAEVVQTHKDERLLLLTKAS
jgi:trans-aconitate methyltransferase